MPESEGSEAPQGRGKGSVVTVTRATAIAIKKEAAAG